MTFPKKISIDNNLSTYLDFLRWMAALTVFISHTQNFLLPQFNFGIFSWGREAVAVFFVLSGLVINYVVLVKEKDWKSYVVARLSRIYPVAFIAILVTIMADYLGSNISPEYYHSLENKFGGFYRPVSLTALFSYLTFTNQIWFHHAIFGTNGVYWSLGFEVQYYVMFAILSFAGNKKIILFFIWMLFAGPKILLYLPLWLTGGLTLNMLQKENFRGKFDAMFFFLISILTILGLRFFLGKKVGNMYGDYPFEQELLNFIYFTAIGLAVMINILASSFLLKFYNPFTINFSKIIKWLANGSFSLYLIHHPLLVLFSLILIKINNDKFYAVFFALLTILICYLLAEIGERKKSYFSKYIFQPLFFKSGQ